MRVGVLRSPRVIRRLMTQTSDSTCSSSMASSTYAGVQRDLGASREVAILSISLFVMGLGVGPRKSATSLGEACNSYPLASLPGPPLRILRPSQHLPVVLLDIYP